MIRCLIAVAAASIFPCWPALRSAESAAAAVASAGSTADSAAHYLAAGRRYFKARVHSKAVAQLRQAVRLAPESAEAHNMLGLAYSFRLQTGKAIEHILKAIALNPDNGIYYLNLGKQHMLLMNHDAARAAYFRAMELGLKKDMPFYDLGIISERENRLGDARDFYRKTIAALPGFAPGYFRLGMVLEKDGDEKRALELYSYALKLDPNLTAAHYRIAHLYLQADRKVLAEIHLDRFRSLKASEAEQ